MYTRVAAPASTHSRVLRTLLVVALAVVTSAAYFTGDSGIRSALLGAGTLTSVVAVYVGIRRYRPADATSWWLLFAASIVFLVGVGTRGDPVSMDSGVNIVPDLFTLTGYALIGIALTRWIRERHSIDDLTPLIDAALIAVGTLFLAWVLFVSPQLGGASSPATAIFNGLYPAIDAGMIALTTYLFFSSEARNRSIRWLFVALVSVLVGDIAYAVALQQATTPSDGLLTGIYLIAYGALALAALDPSMASMSHQQAAAPMHSRRRVVVVIALLTVCAGVPLVGTAASTADTIVRSLLLAVILIGTFLRGERAVTRIKRSEDRATYRAAHDLLTGLPNRTMLESEYARVEQSTSEGIMCVLFVDLDDFKMVNDSYGHRVGDEMIVGAADRLRRSVGTNDAVLRYAGDEFIVVSRRSKDDACSLAASIIENMNNPFQLSAAIAYVSASIGIARAESSRSELDDLIREADTAMYHAKSQGSSRYSFFDESLRLRATSAVETATALRGAVRRGELEVYYQPIVATKSRRTVVYEALVRWNRGGRVLAPAEFVPIAESTNLIKEIGEWVLATAAADLVTLREHGQNVTMSVNVSPVQLRDDTLPGFVADILAANGLAGSDLGLEVTEGALIDDTVFAGRILEELSATGILIVLDDFGMGYSSLSRLRQMPIALLKIDKSFVAEIGTTPAATSLVTAIMAMARALPVSTVAEGVETEVQALALENLECRFAQGYLYGRPAPLAHWLLQNVRTPA